ncbi:hypothetical protein A2W24_00740 [Microgenomates group bacterium RBG_16_45_19]|nr:MAG: hypothetical protein A2W24_00740 [Microgenomates group bacterium RBG_16_45_19]
MIGLIFLIRLIKLDETTTVAKKVILLILAFPTSLRRLWISGFFVTDAWVVLVSGILLVINILLFTQGLWVA